MNYLTEFDFYIDIVLIVNMLCPKIQFKRVKEEDSKKGICQKLV